MRIGIEATALTRDQRTGVDYYTQHLVAAMARARPKSLFELAYFWFLTKPDLETGLALPNIVERRSRWLPSKAYRVLYRLGIAPPLDLLTGARGDFFLFPNFVRWPLALTRLSAVVVHDLSYIHSADTITRRLRRFLVRKVPKSIARSNLVFTPSETIRREVLEEYGVDPRKVIVATPAADRSVYFPRSEAQCNAVLEHYRLRWRQFILFVGTIEPRKNIKRLLDAYAGLPPDIRSSTPLVLVGGKGWKDDGIYRTYQDLKRRSFDVRMLGYVPHERLPYLYSSCSVFVFASLYEGFGMPLLEAMACGAAAVSSSRSSLPEVAGNAAILVDPEDVLAMSAAIERLLRNEALMASLREAAIRRAQAFSWEDSAAVVLKAIESLSSGSEERGISRADSPKQP